MRKIFKILQNAKFYIEKLIEMKRTKFLLLSCLLTFAIGVSMQQARKNLSLPSPDNNQTQNSVKNSKLREELLRRMKADQDLQKDVFGKVFSGQQIPLELLERRKSNEAENTEWIKTVIEQNGYPGFALVGQDGSRAANFLLLQHVRGDVVFQKKVLELAQKAAEQNDADPDLILTLTDRILVTEGKAQVYGTQLSSKNGAFETFPIEIETNVNKAVR